MRPKWGRVWAGCVVAERACRDRDAVIVPTVTRKAAPGGRTRARSSIRGKHLQRGDRTPRLTASRPPCEPSRSFARGFACARVRSLERACGGMAALSARESVAQDAQTSGGWDRRRRRRRQAAGARASSAAAAEDVQHNQTVSLEAQGNEVRRCDERTHRNHRGRRIVILSTRAAVVSDSKDGGPRVVGDGIMPEMKPREMKWMGDGRWAMGDWIGWGGWDG